MSATPMDTESTTENDKFVITLSISKDAVRRAMDDDEVRAKLKRDAWRLMWQHYVWSQHGI